jgi:hypothetical protein
LGKGDENMRKVSEQEQEALLDILRRHEQELRAYRGVHRLDVGYKFEDGKPTDVLAIRVHVGEKKLESELEPWQRLPRVIEGILVDVIQSNPELHQDREKRFDPLVGGVAVGNTRHNFGGTFGAVVFDADTLEPLGISNHHALVDVEGEEGDEIAQPNHGDPNDVIGTLSRWDLNLDCAVFALNDSREISTGISDLLPEGVVGVVRPVVGMTVSKSGRTTGTTFGVVDGVSTEEFSVIPDPENPPPDGEISAGGDSGSVWIDVENSNAVGLHYAGEADEANAEKAWAKRMINVATTLNIRLVRATGPSVPNWRKFGWVELHGSGAVRVHEGEDRNANIPDWRRFGWIELGGPGGATFHKGEG